MQIGWVFLINHGKVVWSEKVLKNCVAQDLNLGRSEWAMPHRPLEQHLVCTQICYPTFIYMYYVESGEKINIRTCVLYDLNTGGLG